MSTECTSAPPVRLTALQVAVHYGQMLLVMIAGMVVVGGSLTLLAALAGAEAADLERQAPAAVLLGMGFSMTAPMVWWMRRRGHSWAATGEMSAAMILPTIGAVALLASATLEDLDSLLSIQHVAMLPAMLAVLLLRRHEYAPRGDRPLPIAHPRAPGLAAALKRRWPTWLAIGMAVVLAPGSSVDGLAEALCLVALAYLAAAALQRRQATWVVAVVAVGALAALRLQDWVDPLVVVFVAALSLVLWGVVERRLGRSRALQLETAGMVIFSALSLTALSLEPEVGRYFVAAGWFGHAAWDAAHLRADKVVARSFAEWCAVFDVLRAIGILVLPLTP